MNKNLIEKIAPQLTELMIKKMETLTEEWRKPWIADLAHGLPRNLRGTPYRGGNILMLLFLSEIAGYSTPLFMTFKQAKEEGLNILKLPLGLWLPIDRCERLTIRLVHNPVPHLLHGVEVARNILNKLDIIIGSRSIFVYPLVIVRFYRHTVLMLE